MKKREMDGVLASWHRPSTPKPKPRPRCYLSLVLVSTVRAPIEGFHLRMLPIRTSVPRNITPLVYGGDQDARYDSLLCIFLIVGVRCPGPSVGHATYLDCG